jgi:hypothetical protein
MVTRLVLIAVLPVVLIAGCGDGGGDSTTDVTTRPRTAPQDSATARVLDTPQAKKRTSRIEGVPIPPSVKRIAHFSDENDDALEVRGMTLEEVKAWYDQRMPKGADFRSWAWCDTGGSEEQPTRIYSKGDNRILAVSITDEPGLLIGTDRSGPCEEIVIGL